MDFKQIALTGPFQLHLKVDWTTNGRQFGSGCSETVFFGKRNA
jgi:hypothetical protein